MSNMGIACFSFILGTVIWLFCCVYTLEIYFPDSNATMSSEHETTISNDDAAIDRIDYFSDEIN